MTNVNRQCRSGTVPFRKGILMEWHERAGARCHWSEAAFIGSGAKNRTFHLYMLLLYCFLLNEHISFCFRERDAFMKKLMLGNEAVARGAYEAGVKVVSSYPGTPSTEITEFSALYPELDCEWAPNEKVAVETAFGAAMAGARAMSCMKHVGLNVAADPLYTAAYTGVNAGLVLCVADDPFMHSSQNEQDTRLIARASHVPVLEPSDSQECLDFARRAFELSETYDTPVILRLTTRLAHQRSPVVTGDRADVPLRPYGKDVMKYVMMPGMARRRHVFVEQREIKMERDASALGFNRTEMRKTALGVVCSGVVYRYVREALPDASVLKLGLTYPLDRAAVHDFASRVEKLVVIEELEGILEQEIAAMGIPVQGKCFTGRQGELSVQRIREAFGGEKAPEEPLLPARPPVLCPGCPHRAAFYVFRKLKLHVFGDIGCYTLCALPPADSLESALCMGASIGMAIGAQKARGRGFARESIAVLGDSTFIHSGITGLVNAVYDRSDITVVILDNRITGMTGHQQNPASGLDIHNCPAPQLDLEKLCRSIGAHVQVCDPMDMKDFEQVLRQELVRDGVSVIIARHPCALLDRRSLPPAQVKDCRNCGACMRLGCPAIERGPEGIRINGALCSGCGLCVGLCAFGAIVCGGGER